MTNTDLHEAMLTLAEGAPGPPPDLLDRVVAGHRRRRRTHAVVAAFAAVILVGAGVWVWRPSTERALPADVFNLPPIPADPPSIPEAWPRAVISDGLEATPDNVVPESLGLIDRTHVLVASRAPGGKSWSMWNYSIADRTYRAVLRAIPAEVTADRVAITTSFIVRLAVDGGRIQVWTSAHDGRSERRIATVGFTGGEVGGLYANDQTAYFSAGGRVMRIPLNGSEADALRTVDALRTDGSPWAANPDHTFFRHLVTGQEIRAVKPNGTDEIQCLPAFCISAVKGKWFVQRPDGTGRTALPYDGRPNMVGALTAPPGSTAQNSGLMFVSPSIVMDPVTGALGTLLENPDCGHGASYGSLGSGVQISWQVVAGLCTGSSHIAYIGAGD
ncbi:hypothetical protein AB0M20_14840 [Actinoplanes sp. NPDC051633]|uniref:hypothetical protein n=1 Tax=Actinoplanes sp. NPDC051633 TaxID=3155670 RepID=UPI00343F909A